MFKALKTRAQTDHREEGRGEREEGSGPGGGGGGERDRELASPLLRPALAIQTRGEGERTWASISLASA